MGCLNIFQPLAVFAMDWFAEMSSLFMHFPTKFNSFMSSSSDFMGEEFCQQTESMISLSDSRVICSVVPVKPDFVIYIWRMSFSRVVFSFSDLKWMRM